MSVNHFITILTLGFSFAHMPFILFCEMLESNLGFCKFTQAHYAFWVPCSFVSTVMCVHQIMFSLLKNRQIYFYTIACMLPEFLLSRWYALSRVIHRIQSEIYFGNPDGYMEWLGTVDHRYPAYHSDLRTLLPSPLCGNPPPPPKKKSACLQLFRSLYFQISSQE